MDNPIQNPLQGDELIIRCRELHDIARQVSETLLALLTSLTSKQKIYIFKHRVKPSKAIWNKVHRNRHEARKLREQLKGLGSSADPNDRKSLEQKIKEGESFGPHQVFDSFGCRYVTLFEEQRLALVRDLFGALDGFKVPAAEDVPVTLFSCSTYYAPTASGSEARANELVELLRSGDFVPRVIPNRDVVKQPIPRAGYSSVHFNFELPVIVDFPRGDDPLDGYSQPQLERARFEVQIRDIFEEAWSESEHYLFYSQKDDFRELSDREIEAVRFAKKLVDGYRPNIDTARTYMSTVKKELDRTRAPDAPKLDIKSTTTRVDDKSAIEAALKGKVDASALEALNQAYDLLKAAESAENGLEVTRNYADAVAKLNLLKRSLGEAINLPVPGRYNRPVKYFVETELANSMIFSQQPDAVIPARQIYADLIKEYPNDPTLRVRYGRSMLFQESPDADHMNQLLAFMKDVKSLIEKDELTGPSHWLLMTAPMLQGFAHYALAQIHQKENRDADAWREFESAIDVTRDGVTFWRGLPSKLKEDETYKLSAFKATSNIICYLAMLIHSGGGKKKGFDEQAVKDQIKENEEIVVRKFQDLYKSLDNKMHGYVVIGDHENAVNMAKEIYGILQGYAATRAGRPVEFHEIGNYLNKDERVNFNAAVNVMISQGHQWT
jgi:ppGpp synthetase/RelA/SpoT-type nucleotidyltranferase